LSGNAVSSQLDFAWRMRNSVFMSHPVRPGRPARSASKAAQHFPVDQRTCQTSFTGTNGGMPKSIFLPEPCMSRHSHYQYSPSRQARSKVSGPRPPRTFGVRRLVEPQRAVMLGQRVIPDPEEIAPRAKYYARLFLELALWEISARPFLRPPTMREAGPFEAWP
jgi:hypothetical protein